MYSVIEYLLSMNEALSLMSSTMKKTKKENNLKSDYRRTFTSGFGTNISSSFGSKRNYGPV
jgi:hypothetical protein